MKPYDLVKVTGFRDSRFEDSPPDFQRNPQAGDTGTIVEICQNPEFFHVECCDGDAMLWLEIMHHSELRSFRIGRLVREVEGQFGKWPEGTEVRVFTDFSPEGQAYIERDADEIPDVSAMTQMHFVPLEHIDMTRKLALSGDMITVPIDHPA